MILKNKALLDNKIHEECGVFGLYDKDDSNGAELTYYGLFALQHRGQESCGIVAVDKDKVMYHKGMGLVSDVFNDSIVDNIKGKIVVGHVRYSPLEESTSENAQPLVMNEQDGPFVIAHNGKLINGNIIKDKLLKLGSMFHTTTDAEIIANLITQKHINNNIEDSIKLAIRELKGSYVFVIATKDKLIGVRDPWGIRPLCIGKLKKSYILASETCALDAIGAKYVKDVEPGEIVIIDDKGIRYIKNDNVYKSELCVFEFVYFARPDSYIEGNSVYEVRKCFGKELAKEHKIDADLVIGVPDSGVTAAIGYALESGIPYGEGLLKNRYIGRTFIKPTQKQRQMAVSIKLNVIKENVKDKRIIMVDDSIVRGTTMKRIVKLIRDAGAKEVHICISSPIFKYPCYFGSDVPSKDDLIVHKYTINEMCKLLDVDSITYLSIDGLKSVCEKFNPNYCMGCFNGKYPVK